METVMQMAKNKKSLRPEEIYSRCDPNQFTFETTAELEDLKEIIGQPRAMDAIKFGVRIRSEGYNLFALGSSAIAKHSVVRHYLKEQAASEPTPDDICYVNNFKQQNRPRLLRLPPGNGAVLRHDIEELVEELSSAIPAVFESEEYATRKQRIEKDFKRRREVAFEQMRKTAETDGVAMMRTPEGIIFAPIVSGEIISPEDYQKLPKEDQEKIENRVLKLQEELQTLVRQIALWERETRERLKELSREFTNLAVGHLIDELRKKNEKLPEVIDLLDSIEQDVLENTSAFTNTETTEEPEESDIETYPKARPPFLNRYRVNVLVDNSKTEGAPVIYEGNPTYQSLVGEIEHISYMGSLVTNFNLIKPGALHRANGGYLMLDAHKVLSNPYAWEGLKRAIRSSEIKIESLGQIFSLTSTVSLEPEPVHLNVKVILLGEQLLYYLLCQLDKEFGELFKVTVDFNDRMDRNLENNLLYAKLIGSLAKKEGLRAFDRGAVARLIEESARIAGDSEKLSAHMKTITDLLREADYWAGEEGHSVINREHVQRAIDEQTHRSDRMRDLVQEEIVRGTILIDTEGEKVGQINGLSVIEMGSFSFGRPTRITARARLGKGEVIDIEREVEMSGPIHSKGILILSSFLGARYTSDQPLSLSASLVFEQSYSGVEGDSASSAELYALLSALAETPIKQSLAVTGSVNQYGQVQAIGGVNEKIEGFFDLCRSRGLTGNQGVLIPASNVKHLMLRHDVVVAVAAGLFHIYPVETIDQGIGLLTGIEAGEQDESGGFPKGCINHKVEARLAALTRKRMMLGATIDYSAA
jgi:lon-related putative ATP-dependent protease